MITNFIISTESDSNGLEEIKDVLPRKVAIPSFDTIQLHLPLQQYNLGGDNLQPFNWGFKLRPRRRNKGRIPLILYQCK